MTPKKMNLVLKGSLVVLALATLGGLYFANQKLTTLALHTTQLKADIEVSNEKLKIYESTQAKIDQLSYVKDLAAEILPQNENQSAIVAELAEFARRSNLQTNSIEFISTDGKSTATSTGAKTVAPPTGVAIVPVSFAVSGGAKYDDVLTFLHYIEDNRRKMQVTQISLTPDTKNGDLLDNVNLSINLFVKKESTAAGAKK